MICSYSFVLIFDSDFGIDHNWVFVRNPLTDYSTLKELFRTPFHKVNTFFL